MVEPPFDIDNIPEGTVTESTELYELTLEQILKTPVQLDAATRKVIRIQNFLEDNRLELVVPIIARRNDSNYTVVMATALVHGLSIFIHEHQDLLDELSSVYEDAIFMKYRVFSKMHSNYSTNVGFNKSFLYIHTDAPTHDQLVAHTKTLKLSLGDLATMCILMSFVECEILPTYMHDECVEKVEMFNISCNVLLQNLKTLRY